MATAVSPRRLWISQQSRRIPRMPRVETVELFVNWLRLQVHVPKQLLFGFCLRRVVDYCNWEALGSIGKQRASIWSCEAADQRYESVMKCHEHS
jgi:hypothetical protein